MKIHYIKLKNYRQYRDSEVYFSTDDMKNFTVIEGVNGAGKSNLLNAITWCLYKEERHLGKDDRNTQLPILNERLYHDLALGKSITVEVELALGDDEIEYVIKREAKVYKRLDGEISVRIEDDPQVMFRAGVNWRTSPQPTYAINTLLPADISHFFFFDGEQLDKFFQDESAEGIKTGIVNVSQIDLLEQSIKHLNNVRTELRRTAQGINPEAESIKADIDTAEQQLKALQEQLAQLHSDHDGLQTNLEQIRQELRNSSIEEVRQQQQNRDKLRNDIKDYEARLKQLQEKAARALRTLGPRVYAAGALREASNMIQERVKRGELPPKVRAVFFNELLEDGVCVCGTEIPKGSAEREKIIKRMELSDSAAYESAADGKSVIQNLLSSLSALNSQQKDMSAEIYEIERAIEEANKQLKEISQKIQKLGEVDPERIQFFEKQHRQFETEQKDIDRLIGRGQAEEDKIKQELERLNRKYLRALEDDKRHKDLLGRLELCTAALEALNETRSEMLAEVRHQIQQKTEEYFLQLIWKKGTYKHVQIDEDYRINVLNVRDMPSLGTLSAGERQVLALAFMAALGTVSGFDAPVVIDTPIGRISGEPRVNIAESLPNYLANTQVTLLMTDTEYTGDVQMRLNSRVGKGYCLNYDESEAVTEVTSRDN